ncbi:MAG: hypothetical protein KF828_04565 [Anaerolineales bacterium]|nr:hypothetical protein [Anaerolineales bacterium]
MLVKFKKLPFPLFLVLIAIAAFGLLIPRLGFYWDDWPLIFLAQEGSPELLRGFFSYIRPLSFWTYSLTMPVLGVTPLHWHLFLLGLRIVAAAQLWLTLRTLWPRADQLAGMASLLFLIYPSFSQGSIAVAYSQHFIVYNLCIFSLYAMLRSLSAQPRRNLWRALAILAAIAHLFTMEYFAGLELLRPLLLLAWFYPRRGSFKQSLLSAARQWLPYLAVLVGFFIWRTTLVIPEDPNRLEWIGIPAFLQATLQNGVRMIVDAWANTLNAALIDFSNRTAMFSLALAAITAATCFAYFRLLPAEEQPSQQPGRQAVWLGAAGIVLSLLPIQLTGRTLLGGLFVDRFSLPAMLGAGLLLAGLLHTLVANRLPRILLLATLVGLAAGAQLRFANEYRWDWEEQQRMYWQFYWRAPSLAAGTSLVGPEVMTAYTSSYAAAAAINTLYHAPISPTGQVDYWVLDYYDNLLSHAEDLESGIELDFHISNLHFTADAHKLILYDNSNYGQCVWFLNEMDQYNRLADPAISSIAPLSQLSLASSVPGPLPNPAIFGEEPEHTWCYYFQKMDLAQQQGQWDEVLALWEESKAQGYTSNLQFGRFPAVEALLMTGREQEARLLSADILLKQPAARDKLCHAWKTWRPDAQLPQELAEPGC